MEERKGRGTGQARGSGRETEEKTWREEMGAQRSNLRTVGH